MSDTLLHAPWALRDVPDVEALCRGVLRELSAGLAQPLERADRDEALGFLLGEAHIQETKWVSKGFDRRAGYVFRPWLYVQLSSRLIDHWRWFYGRHGEKRVFDERLLDADGGVGDGAAPVDRPDPAVAEGAADDAGLRAFPRAWTDVEGDRRVVRPVGGLGLREGAGGAGGDPGPGGRASGRAAGAAAGAGGGASAGLDDCAAYGWSHMTGSTGSQIKANVDEALA